MNRSPQSCRGLLCLEQRTCSQPAARTRRQRRTSGRASTFSFQPDPTCHLRRNLIGIFAGGINTARSLQVSGPALLIKFAKLFGILQQRTLLLILLTTAKKLLRRTVKKNHLHPCTLKQCDVFRVGERSSA